MSHKPIKKSDLEKGWMKPRRDNPRKIRPERHLIVSEGTKTEPLYFGAIKKIIDADYPRRIELDIRGTGENTIGLFRRAKKLADSSPNVFKHVWVVYDIDEFPPEYVDEATLLCRKESNEETIYHAIWSNQCIELWFLLHFAYLQADLDRTSCCRKLSESLAELKLGEYSKNREDLFEVLFPYLDTAIANAKKLEIINEGKSPSESSPGTKVHELMEKLMPYLR